MANNQQMDEKNMGKGLTTIQLSTSTRERLAQAGSKNQTYDNLINELLDERALRRRG